MSHAARLAVFALLAAVTAAPPAAAGILINPKGIFITEPENPAFIRNGGVTRFGSPAIGFRRTGRSGFFPTPRDPGLPFHGYNAFGPAGRALDRAIREERGPRDPNDTIFSSRFWRDLID